MKVVIPYVNNARNHLWPETVEAADRYATNPEYVNVHSQCGQSGCDGITCVSSGEYCDLFKRLWKQQASFVVIEHDIVIRESTISKLANCPRPWCGYTYSNAGGGNFAFLGCTKFDSRIMKRYPLAIEDASQIRTDANLPPGHWVRMDSCISRTLEQYRYRIHEHNPPLQHMNPRQQHVKDTQ